MTSNGRNLLPEHNRWINNESGASVGRFLSWNLFLASKFLQCLFVCSIHPYLIKIDETSKGKGQTFIQCYQLNHDHAIRIMSCLADPSI